MRKHIEKIIGLTLCMGILAGCARTPDSSLVKQKGSTSLDAYKEADSSNSVDKEKNDNTASRTTIRDLINAPASYKSKVTDDSSKLVVNTDATIEIPDVEKISAISVTPAEVTQDLLDRITDAFFKDAKIYTAESYYTKTKEEIKKTIDKLKEDVANGNLDPNNWGTDEDGNLNYNIYDDIEYWEEQYQSAPETKALAEGRPIAGTQSYSDSGEVMGNNEFNGVAQMKDGSEFYYSTSTWGPDPLNVTIKKTVKKGGEEIPSDAVWSEYSSLSPYEKPTEDSVGISLDEAKKLVQEKVDAMGLSDLQQCGWEYAIHTTIGTDDNSSYLGSGYVIYYNRTINGVPLTYTMDAGGALEDMDSTMETWAYENLYFYVDADGIDSMTYANPYSIGDTKTENLSLLPFSEIMKIYEKMMVVTNADNMEYENSRIYDIDRIVLGYARIYEPSTDAHTGLLVPVWDFFGSRKIDSEYDGEAYSDTTDYPTWSFLTINAVDGSMIDRSLGY
nr:DUF6034 family protein [uncultured Blautia sp.]